MFNNLLILNPQVISRPRGGSHDWVWQNTSELQDHHIGHYFPQMIYRLHGGSHNWVRQTPRSFEITVLECFIKHKAQTEF
jgi:hypothetical protein